MPKALVTRSAILAALALGAACTVHQTDVPSLTGPSELALSIDVAATPDSISQDGASQSAIVVTARDANGKAMPALPMRVDMVVGGQFQDFGTLSARTIVTGSDGKATAVYTAPPPPPPSSGGAGTILTIVVTPTGTNFQTATSRTAEIRLVPPGLILPPADTPTPAFTVTPTPVNLNVAVNFNASASCGGAVTGGVCNGSSAITGYSWNFGDGSPAASGMVITHTFTAVATFSVTLTITNDRGLSASTTQTVAVTASAVPTASFVFSKLGMSVVFNADASRAAPGHTIVEYNWIFGDGTTDGSSGFLVTHLFTLAGTYNVTLTVKDETGAESTVSSGVTVP